MKEPARSKRPPRLFTVSAVRRVSAHMIRVTFSSPEIGEIADGCEGANCKLFLPEPGQDIAAFRKQLNEGPRPDVRTYTVRHQRQAACEMDIDFVDHGDAGPASAWARAAQVGAYCGFAGPGMVKVKSFEAEHYLVVADLSALPLAAATLEAMPDTAKGTAIFEITHPDDRQTLTMPAGVTAHWLVNPTPSKPDGQVDKLVRQLPWPKERLQVCIAGESSMIRALRQYILLDRKLPKADAYIAGYWKIGLIEDEHQIEKRKEATPVS
ncbi:siderophore-interacting protein [Neptunicoccus cionae]|uniref:Siderophore-interacting protein n=1 Tax=Neptunicoccus cionae TaxID=2035344 RepID=A0A916VSP4_9RHOB|nr:siderophore-interacting protein [Amylibacter cionae]GGA27396.1 siderophore-interacting protein [Amylibacter cionae]